MALYKPKQSIFYDTAISILYISPGHMKNIYLSTARLIQKVQGSLIHNSPKQLRYSSIGECINCDIFIQQNASQLQNGANN